MWLYQKQLPYPVNVKKQNLSLARIILTQCGGPEGAWLAALSYLNQRHSMPRKEAKALLTDLATEELAHGEMLSALLYQLTGRLPADDKRELAIEAWPASLETPSIPGSGFPDCVDPIACLYADLASERQSRRAFERVLLNCDDPDACGVLRFLRQREIVHEQRLLEALKLVQNTPED
jgi:spore coat protein JC